MHDDNAQIMIRQTTHPRLLIVVLSLLGCGALQAQCVPARNHHCVGIEDFGYVPNLLTVVEGDTVQFSASSFHPLRQVIRAFPDTTPLVAGLACSTEPCVKVMDAGVIDADGQRIFHFICVNHIAQVMRGDITVLPRTIFVGDFED